MALKIDFDHFKTLHDAIERARKECPDMTLDSYKQQGRTAKRWRWDLLWYAAAKILPGDWVTKTLYPYLNDNHIDSALRVITNTK